MPQSARATFKRPDRRLIVEIQGAFQCLNRHEQPSSRQASDSIYRRFKFQCLNRHEQPSSNQENCQAGSPNAVSMPQSARATFKPASSTATSTASPTFQCLNRHEQPSSSLLAGSIIIPGKVSMPQSARATFKPSLIDLAAAWIRQFQCLNRHEQPSSSIHKAVRGKKDDGFNASIGTSNLQARLCQPKRGHGWRFNASIGTSNLQARD